jgi:hypothetical protein
MSRWQRIKAAPANAGRFVGRVISSAFDMRDATLFTGLGLLGYGLFQVYPPAGFIVPGAILAAVATLGTR